MHIRTRAHTHKREKERRREEAKRGEAENILPFSPTRERAARACALIGLLRRSASAAPPSRLLSPPSRLLFPRLASSRPVSPRLIPLFFGRPRPCPPPVPVAAACAAAIFAAAMSAAAM